MINHCDCINLCKKEEGSIMGCLGMRKKHRVTVVAWEWVGRSQNIKWLKRWTKWKTLKATLSCSAVSYSSHWCRHSTLQSCSWVQQKRWKKAKEVSVGEMKYGDECLGSSAKTGELWSTLTFQKQGCNLQYSLPKSSTQGGRDQLHVPFIADCKRGWGHVLVDVCPQEKKVN